MKELNTEFYDDVSGGVWPLVVIGAGLIMLDGCKEEHERDAATDTQQSTQED